MKSIRYYWTGDFFAKSFRFSTLILLAIFLFGLACKGEEINLRVALFPYLPDPSGNHFAEMTNRIKTEFEKQHPDVRLTVEPMDPDTGIFYDYAQLKGLMTTNNPDDVVETDTLFLGKLINDNAIEPWNSLPNPTDWHQAAKSAVFVNGQCYGIPHWLCSFFIFSHLQDTENAKTSKEFVKILDTNGGRSNHLTGNFMGSFTLPAIYLDAYVESHGKGTAVTALTNPIDEDVVASMKLLTEEIGHGTNNPCLDGRLKDDQDVTAVVPSFARGDFAAFFGYSERLFYILKSNPSAPLYTIIAAPLGNGGPPLLYVDAFVMRKGISDKQRVAAKAFAEYMNSQATQEWVLLSRDTQQRIPRYLLPATKSAFDSPGIASDPYYKMLSRAISDADSEPSSGYYEHKDQLKKALYSDLTK